MKKVYIGMSADIIHHGHLNIINTATKLGKVNDRMDNNIVSITESEVFRILKSVL